MPLTIQPLALGDLQLDASFVNWQMECGQKRWYPTTGWLIQGLEKPVLVDTSFRSVEDAARNQGLTARRSPDQSIETQLSRFGVGLDEIGTVIHTHIHMDHAGQDYLLPNARFVLQRRELQVAAAPDMYPVPFYDRLNVARLIDPLWPRVDLLEGEAEIFPGVHCVPMPGHTAGHQAIYVQTASGTTIICGDAAMNVDVNVRQGVPPGFLDDMSATMRGLRKLKQDGTHILPTHDPTVFSLYPEGVA